MRVRQSIHCVQQRIVPHLNAKLGIFVMTHQCLNCSPGGCEWEFLNFNELDGTPDQSHWTSIETDYQLWTSPSVNAQRSSASSLKDKKNGLNRKYSKHTSVSPKSRHSSLVTSVDRNESSKSVHIREERSVDSSPAHV